MCMLSLVVFAMPMTQADTAALDVHATKLEQATRGASQRYNYTGIPVDQTPGPVRPLVIPRGHSRQSRLHPLRYALAVAEEVDLDAHHRIGGIIDTPTERAYSPTSPTPMITTLPTQTMMCHSTS